MAAPSRWPDPYDPAGDDLWWPTHDRIEAIASDAARIAVAARAALAKLRAGHGPDLDDLADLLDHWWWSRDSLDLAAQRAILLDPSFDSGADQ